MVLCAGVLWSFMGLFIRLLGEVDTWSILFYRSLGTLPVLAGFVWWRSGGQLLSRIRAVGWPGIVGGLGLVVAFAGAIYAIQATTIANAVFLFAASPLLAALLGWVILREEVRLATWGAILVAAVGMLVMVREGLAAGALLGNLKGDAIRPIAAATRCWPQWFELFDVLQRIPQRLHLLGVGKCLVVYLTPPLGFTGEFDPQRLDRRAAREALAPGQHHATVGRRLPERQIADQ